MARYFSVPKVFETVEGGSMFVWRAKYVDALRAYSAMDTGLVDSFVVRVDYALSPAEEVAFVGHADVVELGDDVSRSLAAQAKLVALARAPLETVNARQDDLRAALVGTK